MVDSNERRRQLLQLLYYLRFHSQNLTYAGEITPALVGAARASQQTHVAIYELSRDQGPEIFRLVKSDLSQLERDGLIHRPRQTSSVNLTDRALALIRDLPDRPFLDEVASRIAECHLKLSRLLTASA